MAREASSARAKGSGGGGGRSSRSSTGSSGRCAGAMARVRPPRSPGRRLPAVSASSAAAAAAEQAGGRRARRRFEIPGHPSLGAHDLGRREVRRRRAGRRGRPGRRPGRADSRSTGRRRRHRTRRGGAGAPAFVPPERREGRGRPLLPCPGHAGVGGGFCLNRAPSPGQSFPDTSPVHVLGLVAWTPRVLLQRSHHHHVAMIEVS